MYLSQSITLKRKIILYQAEGSGKTTIADQTELYPGKAPSYTYAVAMDIYLFSISA